MGMRHRVKVRGGAGVAISAALLLTLAGCGEDGQAKTSPSAPPVKSATPSAGSQPQASSSQPSAPPQIIATAKGEAGIVLDINSAARDAGGFITVSGQIKNTGDKPFGNTAAWRGNELKASGVSMAGVTLVDKVGKKRYYVLRDTDGRCLCTTGVVIIEAGQSVPFFAQFPAPPATTSEVEFNFPTFASTTLKISG
ncbi:hypothetical protein MTF65_10950 [Streptomyces sp. APSN-46.1]|uniref:hypothetical protein n=1 Tax=Streptomyces sp. APSN-46.1 TaxID=2929049 RepID=UPI001FB4AA4A|nr:hypothetical protein [Streptomyces sp. APSN-46.1]MCJ1677851.1 hypothetical protein [Streptomyces sp. APSN-46.1]